MTCLLRNVIAILFCSLIMAGTLRAADEDVLEFVSWAPIGGPNALWQDALGGLQASVKMYNAHGGIGGRQLEVQPLLVEENRVDFLASLASYLEQNEVVGAVGGLVPLGDQRLADFMRSNNHLWFGPWSNNVSLYQELVSDPFAILPTWDQELNALLAYIRDYYQALTEQSGPVYLVYYNIESEQQMATWAREKAQQMGLELKRAPINLDYKDWPYLVDHVKGAGAVIVWINHGPAAAFVRAAKTKMPTALYLTNSLNATNRNLVVLSGGAWDGLIFPAVVRPSGDIPQAFGEILKEYGPVGLESSYQAYLGFAQGRLLARAVNLWSDKSQESLAQQFYNLGEFPTLLAAPINYDSDRHVMGENCFYLAQAYGNGYWRKAPAPSKFLESISEVGH